MQLPVLPLHSVDTARTCSVNVHRRDVAKKLLRSSGYTRAAATARSCRRVRAAGRLLTMVGRLIT